MQFSYRWVDILSIAYFQKLATCIFVSKERLKDVIRYSFAGPMLLIKLEIDTGAWFLVKLEMIVMRET